MISDVKKDLKLMNQYKKGIMHFQEEKEQLLNLYHSPSFEGEGGSYRKSTEEKIDKVMKERENCDRKIERYKYLIMKIENAIDTVLLEEERKIINLYINYPHNASLRISKSYEMGYSKSTYYNILNRSFDKLNNYLYKNEIK